MNKHKHGVSAAIKWPTVVRANWSANQFDRVLHSKRNIYILLKFISSVADADADLGLGNRCMRVENS